MDDQFPSSEQSSRNSATKYWLLATVVLVLLIGIAIFVQWRGSLPQESAAPRALPVITPEVETMEELREYVGARPIPPVATEETAGSIKIEDEHIRGNPETRIAIVEYSSLSLPYARLIHPELKKFIEQNAADAHWIFRHFALTERPLDYPAAKLSECAYEQGGSDAFWSFVDALYETPPETEGALFSLAESLAEDTDLLYECYDRPYTEKLVKDDKRLGLFDGKIQLVPSFIFVDTATGQERVVSGIVPMDFFQSVLNEMLRVKP